MKDISLTLISDFNVEPLRRLLSNKQQTKNAKVHMAPFGQVYQSLSLAISKETWGVVVWTLPERIIPSYARAFNLEEVDHSEVLSEVDHFAESVLAVVKHAYVFLATWVLPPSYGGYGALDWRVGLGLRHLLASMNIRLAEKLSSSSNVFLMDAERWLNQIAQPESPKMWYSAKVPYSLNVFEKAAQDIIGAIESVQGLSRRLVVLDLDNTLWGGVIGETGWEGIRLGGHDHIGEAFKSFQSELKALTNRGIQLAIVSKNDEKVALDALDKHPEMILHRADFVAWRINWQDKASNIVSLVEELGLGFASVVFIDDNPAERDRVVNALPQILVPEWPQDPSVYVATFRALTCFNSASMSREDRDRKNMYVAERARKEIRQSLNSPDEWLLRLGTRLVIDRINASNSTRVAQLFNKTNQLNLSTRRLSESEIITWAKQSNHALLAVTASDKFGDMGLVGIIGMEVQGKEGQLTDLILSCRVMGRQVEETMLHLAVSQLAAMGALIMKINYQPTDRNRPTLEVLRTAGLTETSPHHFEVLMENGFPKPQTVELDFDPNM
jgi:FkbH-like protein